MLVTREADYAVRCVAEVARVGRTSAAQVARSQGISPTFLGKIVQSLARAGILATRRGVGGGIALAGPPESFTLLQVIEAIEGPLSIVECLRSPEGCPQAGGCPAYPYLSTAQALLREALDVTFAELLEGDVGAGLDEDADHDLLAVGRRQGGDAQVVGLAGHGQGVLEGTVVATAGAV